MVADVLFAAVFGVGLVGTGFDTRDKGLKGARGGLERIDIAVRKINRPAFKRAAAQQKTQIRGHLAPLLPRCVVGCKHGKFVFDLAHFVLSSG